MKLRVGVLRGGWSEEREISLKTGEFVLKNLKKSGHEVKDVILNNLNDILNLEGKVDFIFIALHGRYGEGGYIQSLLEMMKIPYSSASPLPSQIGMNKLSCKRVLKTENIPVIDDVVLDYKSKRILTGDQKGYKEILNKVCLRRTAEIIRTKLSYPVFVKPNDSGSSYGISKVTTEKELRPAVKEAKKYSDIIIIEKDIKGKELTVGFVGKTILPPILIIPKAADYFDYTSKYEINGANEICPAPIPSKTTTRLKKLTLKIRKILDIETYARVDYIWDEEKDIIYTLEVNTVPGMTSTSLFPRAARTYGWTYPELLENIINTALKARPSSSS